MVSLPFQQNKETKKNKQTNKQKIFKLNGHPEYFCNALFLMKIIDALQNG